MLPSIIANANGIVYRRIPRIIILSRYSKNHVFITPTYFVMFATEGTLFYVVKRSATDKLG